MDCKNEKKKEIGYTEKYNDSKKERKRRNTKMRFKKKKKRK